MLRVLSACVGITKEGLITETTRAFGFSRSGANIKPAMNTAYAILKRKGYIQNIDGKIVLEKRNG